MGEVELPGLLDQVQAATVVFEVKEIFRNQFRAVLNPYCPEGPRQKHLHSLVFQSAPSYSQSLHQLSSYLLVQLTSLDLLHSAVP